MAKFKDVEMPGDLYYFNTDNHIWLKIEENKTVRCGIDQFGQKAAGTMAYVKFKPPGGKSIKGRPLGTVEAGKYIGPVRAPVNGTIREINQEVIDEPTLINTDSYGRGWIAIIEPDNLDEDINDLIHGEENVQAFLEADYKKYEDEGLFAEEKED